MAFYDDVYFVVSHIRNSYVTSDDTGTCELVILNETLPAGLKRRYDRAAGGTAASSIDVVDGRSPSRLHGTSTTATAAVTAQAQSLEIVSDMDLVAHRRRSNTAQRLERLKKERQTQALIKRVQWREPPPTHLIGVDDQRALVFPKKDLPEASTSATRVKYSLLAELLDKLPAMPNNPFTEFAKFGGSSYAGGMPVKRISIFLTMMSSARRAYPMPVSVVASAKVHELVGLICWKYTHERREPKLRNSVDHYSLHIAEDDGEVDLDFPCLDSKEVISKFGFSVLALVEKGSGTQHTSDINVTVHVAGEGSSTFSVESLSLTLGDVLDKFIKQKRLGGKDQQIEWRLAKRREPDVQLDTQSTLASVETLDFCLVTDGQSRNDEREDWSQHDMSIIEAPLYQSYVVAILNKVRSKTNIHLGISGEKIEIVPLQHQKSSKMIWSRAQKPVSYDTQSVANCDIIQMKSTGKTVFRLTCLVPDRDYKNHDFEAESKKAAEIVQKINHILQLRLSQARRDYLAQRERKTSSFTQRKSPSGGGPVGGGGSVGSSN